MNISVICPLYNAEDYIEKLQESILKQKGVNIESIHYVLTESEDNTENILKEIQAKYSKIRKEKFSHSLTREEIALKSKGDIVVFVTQDVIIMDDNWLYNLTKDIIKGECEAAFSRQISVSDGIEKYIRLKNYPEESRIVSKNDIEKLGLMTFFFSDVSSAIRKDIFIRLNGYSNKDLIISEDMYIAYKLVMNDYRIKYCGDSVVVHSHDFTLTQLYKRYYDTGIFFKENNYLNKYKVNTSGIKLAKYVIGRAVEEKNYKVLIKVIPNFAARFVGMKMGKRKANSNSI
ncbi:MAG: glycosyltransferase [Clostridium sp.]|uniref:glycosyltransferase n=1 Tax=Clostridium sp. TaxID=1506 RepID=UPI003D6D67CC